MRHDDSIFYLFQRPANRTTRASENSFPRKANLMKYDSFDTNADDEPGYADDDSQQDNETATGGAGFVTKKHGSTVDHITVVANPVDADLLADLATVPEQEQIEVRRGKKAEDDEEREPESRRDAAVVKQQNKEKLAAAQASFGKLPKLPKGPANDNFRPVVSWPLMDQLTRSTFEPDRERRTKNIISARYLRDLIDMAGADALANDNDCEVQRTESGKAWFEHGQTLDRKKVIYDNKNGESDAERYSGPVRTAKNSVLVSNSGFGSNRDDPFPVRVMAAREELDAIITAVGPLWPSLFAAVSENATMTDIGLALGAKSALAPTFGSLIIRLAMTAAMEALSRRNEVKDELRKTTPLPVKSRGSFWNQTSGPIMRVAA
jgi:hypothetical protein